MRVLLLGPPFLTLRHVTAPSPLFTFASKRKYLCTCSAQTLAYTSNSGARTTFRPRISGKRTPRPTKSAAFVVIASYRRACKVTRTSSVLKHTPRPVLHSEIRRFRQSRTEHVWPCTFIYTQGLRRRVAALSSVH
ncbi:hypothetical protein C2E23DRAFT_64438 [Lenzites betulinus]|nr:hypothetical protein C2E23DRAFT_64438 [Lenzites betulinus]